VVVGIQGVQLARVGWNSSRKHGMVWTRGRRILSTRMRRARCMRLLFRFAVDPMNGSLYAVWTDAFTVWFSASNDQVLRLGRRRSPSTSHNSVKEPLLTPSSEARGCFGDK
jgi:hypothetical protein